MEEARKHCVFIASNNPNIPPEILEASKTAGGHPGIFSEPPVKSYPSLEVAKAELGVAEIADYQAYSAQAVTLGIPPHPLGDNSNAYFGVDGRLRSIVFLENRHGVITPETACVLHHCQKDAIIHQIQSGGIQASGQRFIADEALKEMLLGYGNTVKLGGPLMIRDMALGEVSDDGLPRLKHELEASFVHVIRPATETEFLTRGSPVHADMPLEQIYSIAADWRARGEAGPEIGLLKITKKVRNSEIAATIVAHPLAFDPGSYDEPFKIDEEKLGADMNRFQQMLAKAFPERKILVARTPEELAGHYRRFWIHI
ncbi:MAG: hypothetical protein GF416_06275 [Candidatus Altiarchaeales archaeon]|nr:hypothetical protein [Candidatus Altiarchaeales archaeon]MBD3416722.1 hypothetical protein [Candidatus Altiarchaeales archaeon]